MMQSTPRHHAGFTLIEVLVAFTVLVMCVGVITVIFGNGLQIAATAQTYQDAVAVAESRLAELSVAPQLQPGSVQGVAANGLPWRIDIQPGILPFPRPTPPKQPDYYRIAVTVAWPGGQFVLNTLRQPPNPDGADTGGEDNPEGEGETEDENSEGGDENPPEGNGPT